MTLNGLTKRVELYDGQVAFHFLPFQTLKTRILSEEFEKTFTDAGKEIDQDARGYFNATHTISQVELLTESPDFRAQCLLHWWGNKPSDWIGSYDLWVEVMADDARAGLFTAWIDNLETLPRADEALHEGRPNAATDPEPSSAGGKPGKKKSSR